MSTPSSSFIPATIQLHLPDDLSKDQLSDFPAYKTWMKALSRSLDSQSESKHPFHNNPYRLHGVTVQSVDRFGGDRLGFVKFKADIRTDDGEKLPGSVFLRGGSVAMLLVLKPDNTGSDEEFTILTVQPRVPSGSLSFTEIPAGMIDDSGTFSGAAAKEIEEETGLKIEESELVDMTELALEKDDSLQNAVYPSAGGSDEFIPIFLARKTMSRKQIDDLQGKLTGLRNHGEKITLKIVKLRDVWREAGRDVKALSALCLYENLRREGKV